MAEIKLGINQRMPLDILHIALEQELQCIDDASRIEELLRSEYQGENRIKKAFNQIKSTIKNNPIKDYLVEHKDEVLNALKSKTDRNLILTAITAARYSFCYDVMVAFGKQFRLQDTVNSDVLCRLIAVKYGANKSVNNTLYYIIPQLAEAQMFSRPAPGEYTYLDPQQPCHKITWDIWKESYYVNEPLTSRDDDGYLFHPYFRFIKDV